MDDASKIKYSWEQVESLWEKRYDFLSKKTGIPLEKIRNSRQQLLVAFGLDWVKKQYKNQKPQGSIPKGASSNLIQILSNPIENNAFPMVELANYLNEFSNQKNFQLVMSMLKDENSFNAARLGLATAYRFVKVDFTEITLEPDTPKGKADIQGKFKNQKFLIECSIIEVDKLSDYFRETLFTRLKKSISDQSLEAGIEVNFKQPPTYQQVNETIDVIKTARHAFGNFKQNPNLSHIKFSSSVAEGRVFKLSDKEKTIPPLKEIMDKWDAIYGVDLARMKDKDDIYTTDIDNATVKGRLFIKGLENLDNEDLFYSRLKTKLEGKLSQTHGVDNNIKRLFVIMTENRVETYNYQKIWEGIKSAMKTRPNVAGMFFVCRWQTDLDGKMRYAYPLIMFVNSFYQQPELDEVFPMLKAFERSDWIND